MPEQTAVEQQAELKESNDAFEAGFGEAPAQAPAEPEKKVEEAKEPKTEEVKEQAPDPWAGVPPVVKAQFDSLNTKLDIVDKLPDRLRNIEGHIGGLTTQIKAAAEASKAVVKAGGEAPTQAQIEAASASSEKWKRIKEDYPEWVDAMEERLASIRPVTSEPKDYISKTDFEAKITEVSGTNADLRRELQEDLIEHHHEGWKDTVKSSEFVKWFEGQKPEVKALSKSPKARDAIRLIDAFKADKSAAAEKAKKDKEAEDALRAGVTPKGTGGRAVRHTDENDAFENGFNAA